VRRNPRPTGTGVPLPLQQQAFSNAQRGARTGTGRGRGQAYNLTTEDAEASKVVAGKILVHSNPVLPLFDSGASHCFILSKFTALHCIVD